jgi:hypothetical protein
MAKKIAKNEHEKKKKTQSFTAWLTYCHWVILFFKYWKCNEFQWQSRLFIKGILGKCLSIFLLEILIAWIKEAYC